MPRQRLADAEAMERYEWMYGRSMGKSDELLQRLRVSQPMPSVNEYHADMTGSASTGLLSNPGAQTPEARAQGRLSSIVGSSSGDLQEAYHNHIACDPSPHPCTTVAPSKLCGFQIVSPVYL
jgi:hypothetical protein